jgi:hypothetical protein
VVYKNFPKKLYIPDSGDLKIEALTILALTTSRNCNISTNGGALRLMFQLPVSKPINQIPKSRVKMARYTDKVRKKKSSDTAGYYSNKYLSK